MRPRLRSRVKPTLVSPAVAVAPADLVFDSLNGEGYPLRDWLTSFPFLLVAIDPYTHESAWILETAGRVLDHYSSADVRVGWVATTDAEGCRRFLGPWSESYLTFPDPDRELVKSLGVERMPALIFIRNDGAMEVVDGWDPTAWRRIVEGVSGLLSWTRPIVPRPGDPTPYAGTPVDGA